MKVVNQECIKGFVEGRHMEGKTIVLHGWAENRSGNNKIIIRNCEKCINGGGAIDQIREDVAAAYQDKDLLISGWRIEINSQEVIQNQLEVYLWSADEDTYYLLEELEQPAYTNNMFIGYNLQDLIKNGLRVGKNFNLQPDCFIDYSHCWLISIGDNVIFAPRVHIIAHDASTRIHSNATRIGRVKIGNNVFLGNNVIVLPNVEIGDGAIVGAGSVVTKSIPPNCVYAGNPAKFICSVEEYIERTEKKMQSADLFDESYAVENGVTEEKRQEMLNRLDTVAKIGFMI